MKKHGNVPKISELIKDDEMLSEVLDDEDEQCFTNGMPSESF
jgi:hypothetical protein